MDRRTADSFVAAGIAGLSCEPGAGLRDRSLQLLPVRERLILEAGGKLRRLGIATIGDRVVQPSLKLVLEPIFEANFLPCSCGVPSRACGFAGAVQIANRQLQVCRSVCMDQPWVVYEHLHA